MRPASKNQLFSFVFAGHVRRRMRRHFSAVYLDGLEHLASVRPAVLFSNHSAWWDSLLCFDLIHRTLKRDGYAMMDEASLDKVPFLNWIGGFGVRIGDREDGDAALAYAAALLDRPSVVVMFPQGRETPSSKRPLGFRPGVSRLLSLAPHAAALPMAMRYEHGRDERPIALVSIGAPLGDRALETCEAAVRERLAVIENALLDGSFAAWHAHLPPVAPRWVGAAR